MAKPRRTNNTPFRFRIKCTVSEAVEHGGLGKTTIHNLIKTGRVKSSLVDGRRLIDVPSFLAILDGNEPEARVS